MDKLKPILAQKFWILSGLCLLLPLFGWWWDTAAMSKDITARTATIKDAFDGIPKPGPNETWTQQVELKNKEEEAKVIKTGDQLWDMLVPYMTWPEAVSEVVAKTTYRGSIDPTTRGKYRDAYEREMLELPKIISPFNEYDSTGLVIMQPETIHSEHLGQLNVHPSDKVTWDAQEDIWLHRTLLEAIARTNERAGAATLLNSVIKQIDVIMLRGGTPKTPGAAAAASPAGGMKPPGGGPMMPGGPGPGAPAMAMPAGGGQGFAAAAGEGPGQGGNSMSASFDPAEEFGSDADTSGGAAGSGAMGPGAKPPGGGPAMPPMGGMGPTAPPAGFGGQQSAATKRYIEETKRYKTRGFYMEVVMDHRKLPEFLAELSDSPWPLRIVRVQQVDRDLADIGSTIVGSSAGAAMGPGGPGAGMRAGPGAGHEGGRPAPAMNNPMGPASGKFGPGAQRILGQPGEGGNSEVSEAALDATAALADPNLVNVAIAGIITLYLPPDPVAPAAGLPAAPGVPGAPTVPATGAPAPGTPGAPGSATPTVATPGTPAGTVSPTPASGATAVAGPEVVAPANGTAPANPPADGAATQVPPAKATVPDAVPPAPGAPAAATPATAPGTTTPANEKPAAEKK